MILFETSGNLMVALGKTIFHSVWAGMLILALLRIILVAIPERLSHWRYKVSVVSLLMLGAVVAASFFLLFTPKSQPGNDQRVLELFRDLPQFMGRAPGSEWTWEPNLLFTLFTYIYFAGILFMVGRSVLSYGYIRNLRRSGQAVEEKWHQRLIRVSHALGIRRKVAFLESDQVTGPLLLGILKPVVIVPLGMFTQLSVSQVETILIHELYHLKRLDYLVNLMQLFMEGLLFYNPAVWLISDRIRREREYCCDDAVVLISKDPLDYAKALVRLAEEQQYIRLAPGAGGSRRTHFVTRIGRIIKRNDMKKNSQEKVMSFLLLVGAIGMVILVSSFGSGFSISKQLDERPMHKPQLMQDTIRNSNEDKEGQKKDVDWDQIKEDVETARMETMEEIDWDQIKEDMEAARIEAMEEIDWDQIKDDIEDARMEAMEEIDWDQIKDDIEDAKIDALADMDFDFDMDAFRENFEQAREEMEEIDWDQVKEEMEQSLSEIHIDVEEMRLEIEESLEDIDWDEIRIDMENSRRDLDSLHIEKDN